MYNIFDEINFLLTFHIKGRLLKNCKLIKKSNGIFLFYVIADDVFLYNPYKRCLENKLCDL